MEEKLQELLQSEEFVKKLAECPDKNKVQELFASEDVKLSMEEIDTLGKALKQAIKKVESGEGDGKLTEDELENVAGGELFALISIAVVAVVAIVGVLGHNNGWWD